MVEQTKTDLFIELAQPDENGISRWVDASEFTGKYAPLQLGNGGSWCRKESTLAKRYVIVTDKKQTPGNSIDRIRLNGFSNINSSQMIREDIKKEIQKLRCVVLGTSHPEVDHKNGMKNDDRVMQSTSQQLITDFQPLSKAANDAKRQFCKECMETGIRYDAAKDMGYPMSYYKGDANYSGDVDSCIGCFWYDPIEFRRHLKFVPNPNSEEKDK